MENNSQIWQRYLKVERLEIAKIINNYILVEKSSERIVWIRLFKLKMWFYIIYNIREILKDRYIIKENTSDLYKLKFPNRF